MDSCIFCKIIRGEIPSTKVYENEDVFAFRETEIDSFTKVLSRIIAAAQIKMSGSGKPN